MREEAGHREQPLNPDVWSSPMHLDHGRIDFEPRGDPFKGILAVAYHYETKPDPTAPENVVVVGDGDLWAQIRDVLHVRGRKPVRVKVTLEVRSDDMPVVPEDDC